MPGLTPPPGDFHFIRTLPGRAFLLSGLALLLLLVVQQVTAPSAPVEIIRKVVSLAFIASGVWLAGLTIVRARRRFLWRVRRKLILSYVFLAVVPVILVVVFALVGGFIFYTNVAAYMFGEGFTDTVEDVRQIAETTAGALAPDSASTRTALDSRYASLKVRYPALSFVVLPVRSETAGSARAPANAADPVAAAGAWRHLPAPALVPAWVATGRGFAGVLTRTTGNGDGGHLVIRAAAPTADRQWMVIVDLPVDTDIIARLRDRTATEIGDVRITTAGGAPLDFPSNGLFRQTVAFMDCTDWETGQSGRVAIHLDAPLGRLYARLTAAQSASLAPDFGRSLILALVVLGVLSLIIEGSALFLGAWFGRSITSAIHELFIGTERLREGDFKHRIRIESRDQLGDLADEFNRMIASMEHHAHVQREKQRLDDELRIAREIQRSLLPTRPPEMAGLSVAALCEPAREVGGDYYDFFEIGPRQLAVLIADVSGKGTSAALYMAELKGLMLALSHTERSPRRLLIELNRLLADHLDNRSFITMAYGVLDLEAGTFTFARAGHTPLIVVSGGESRVLIPDGMVLGLRLPGAGQRFELMLKEQTCTVRAGDVIVLYTDGITEAMDAAGELFGDAALATVLSSHQDLDPAGIREQVVRDIKAFVGDAEPHDDMTMVVLKITGDGRA
jgi:sigma-B regulation protein RsbU (phosphoserine phosphatase)